MLYVFEKTKIDEKEAGVGTFLIFKKHTKRELEV